MLFAILALHLALFVETELSMALKLVTTEIEILEMDAQINVK